MNEMRLKMTNKEVASRLTESIFRESYKGDRKEWARELIELALDDVLAEAAELENE